MLHSDSIVLLRYETGHMRHHKASMPKKPLSHGKHPKEGGVCRCALSRAYQTSCADPQSPWEHQLMIAAHPNQTFERDAHNPYNHLYPHPWVNPRSCLTWITYPTLPAFMRVPDSQPPQPRRSFLLFYLRVLLRLGPACLAWEERPRRIHQGPAAQ